MPYLERAPAIVAAPVLGLALLGLLAGYTPDTSGARLRPRLEKRAPRDLVPAGDAV
jgi:hypothetical protein